MQKKFQTHQRADTRASMEMKIGVFLTVDVGLARTGEDFNEIGLGALCGGGGGASSSFSKTCFRGERARSAFKGSSDLNESFKGKFLSSLVLVWRVFRCLGMGGISADGSLEGYSLGVVKSDPLDEMRPKCEQ